MYVGNAGERIAADLRFFFRDAAGAIGLKSNFGGMVASLEGGGFNPRHTYEVDERKLQAAERARKISAVLDELGWERVVLGVAYKYPDGDERLIGILATTKAEYKRSRTKRDLRDWLDRLRQNKDSGRRFTFALLRDEALQLLTRALDEYSRVSNRLNTARRRREAI
jgi:hypothetical protein